SGGRNEQARHAAQGTSRRHFERPHGSSAPRRRDVATSIIASTIVPTSTPLQRRSRRCLRRQTLSPSTRGDRSTIASPEVARDRSRGGADALRSELGLPSLRGARGCLALLCPSCACSPACSSATRLPCSSSRSPSR